MVRRGRGSRFDVVLNLRRLADLVFSMTQGLARVAWAASRGGVRRGCGGGDDCAVLNVQGAPPLKSSRSREGPGGALSPMAMIWPCGLSVEAYAAAGKDVVVPRATCGTCGRPMAFWSGYWRSVRDGIVLRIWVKRCRCRPCRSSDALLPSFCLSRRLDSVEVAGPALMAVAAGAGTRRVARGIDELFAHTTLRGWWRQHRRRAGWVAGVLWPAGPRPVGDRELVAALQGFGEGLSVGLGVSTWAAVSLALGGSWLSTNTTTPSKSPTDGGFMAVVAPNRAQAPP